jgi:predicted RNA-binding protein with TRAM domain
MKKVILLILIFIVSLSLTAQTTYYVKATGGSDSNNGTTWSLAFASLQTALNVAVSGDKIWVAKGTYIPTTIAGGTADNRDKTFYIASGIAVYGGFAGTETAGYDLTLRDFVTNETILSGALDATPANNAYHTVVIIATSAASTLDGFSVTAGNANGSTFSTIGGRSIYRSQGGGINAYSNGSNVYLTNNNVTTNLSTNWGGGVFALTGITAGSVYIIKNNINNNNCAASNGAGIYAQNVASTNTYIANNIIYSNITTGNGGAVYFNAVGTMNFVNNTISKNTGSSVYCYYPTASTGAINITNSIVYGNTSNTITNNGTGTTIVNYSIVGGGFTGTGNLSSDPLFVDALNNNFHLTKTSTALNVGNNASYDSGLYGSVDLDNSTRTYATTIDMGAYEFVSRTYYVKATGGNDNNTGSTWSLAFATLQKALGLASSGDKIWVAKGTYIPSVIAGGTADNRDKTFYIASGISVYGGFAGIEIANYNISQRDFVTNETILSGALDATPANNAYHVVVIIATNALATLDGFTLTSGLANGTSYSTIGLKQIQRSQGGGINAVSNGANVNLTNNTISSNSSTNSGGGVMAYNTSTAGIMSIIKNNINNNSCGASNGGGMYVQGVLNTLFYVVNNVIFSNSASSNNGGGVYLYSLGQIYFVNNTVSKNTAATGAVYCYTLGATGTNIYVSNSIIYGNTPNTIGTHSTNAGTTAISDCIIGGGYIAGKLTTGTNVTNSDPLFVDGTNNNFQLSSASTAKNVGNNTLYDSNLYGSSDLIGNARIQNTTIDMGAYETTTPGAPVVGIITPGNAQLSVAFTIGTIGTSPITNYKYSTDGGSTFTACSPVQTTSPIVVTSLTNGTAYNVQIKAVNAYGDGIATASTAATPRTVPGAPTVGTAVVAGNSGRAGVAFTAPASNGGSVITSYTATSTPGNITGTLSQAGDGTIIVNGLTNGTAYTFTVTANNAAGVSAASAASNSVTPSTTPGAPTITGVTIGNGQLSLAFTSGSTGGSALTNYKYSIDNGATFSTRQTGTTASPIVITGLTNGTSYNVQIKAVNANGDGTATGTTVGTPSTTPSAASITGITAGNAQLSVAFTAGSTGGSATTNYKYSTDGGTSFISSGSTSSPILISTLSTNGITGLSNGTTYNIQLKAVNANGDGTATGSTSAIPLAPSITVALDANISDLATSAATDITVNNGVTLLVNATKSVNSIVVLPGGKLTLSSGQNLSTGTFTLQSNETGTATFVDNNTSEIPQAITGTVEQYLPQGRNWYVSSPIGAGSNVNLNTGDSVISYYEPGGQWQKTTGALTPLKGYISVSKSGTATNNVSFTGTLNSGPQTISLTRSGTNATKPGFNLVGNPYPSYVRFAAATKSKLDPTIWYRTKNGSGAYVFDTFNGVGTNNNGISAVSDSIPPMQAFWVRVTAGQTLGSLSFDNSMRTHKGIISNKLKAPSALTTSQQVVRLQVSNGTNSDEAIVLFNPNASNGYDSYDSPKLTNGNTAIPEIYTSAGTESLVINGLNSVTADQEIPLGFTPGATNNFSIKATEFSNFDSNTRIVLKDYQTESEQDITDGSSYAFNSNAAATTSRFSVLFRMNSVTTGISPTNKDDNGLVFVYQSTNGQIAVNIPNELSGKCMVSVYNGVGLRLETKLLTGTITKLSQKYSSGVYIVTVVADRKTITRRVVIN